MRISKLRSIVFATAICLLAPQTGTAQEVFKIDNSHSSMVFAVSHFNLSFTYGRFNKCSGEFTLDGGMADSFKFTVDANSIDTNDDERDKHLRGPDFFNTEIFPSIKFQSKSISREGETYQVVGDLTMLDKTKEVTLPIQLVGVGKGPFGKSRAGFFTKFKVKRSDFGMDSMLQAVGNTVSITFSFEGIREQANP